MTRSKRYCVLIHGDVHSVKSISASSIIRQCILLGYLRPCEVWISKVTNTTFFIEDGRFYSLFLDPLEVIPGASALWHRSEESLETHRRAIVGPVELSF